MLPVLCDEHIGLWRSLVARLVRDEEAAGSNPVSPTDRQADPERIRLLPFSLPEPPPRWPSGWVSCRVAGFTFVTHCTPCLTSRTS
jgi:hypothetical protein